MGDEVQRGLRFGAIVIIITCMCDVKVNRVKTSNK